MKLFRGKLERFLCGALPASMALVLLRDEPEIIPFLVLGLFYFALRALRNWRERGGDFNMARLNLLWPQIAAPESSLPAAPQALVERTSLCDTCAFSRIVLGYGAGESLVTCGYPYPPQFIPFPVRDCSDYKAKREVEQAVNRSSVEGGTRELLAAATVRNEYGGSPLRHEKTRTRQGAQSSF
jgi:hypothetical protein